MCQYTKINVGISSVKRKVLHGARKIHLTDHHLVRAVIKLGGRGGGRGATAKRSRKRKEENRRSQLHVSKSCTELVVALSAIPSLGLTWSNATSAIYKFAKRVVRTKRRRSKYWVYNSRVEVDRIIAAVRKVARNTREAQEKARKELAV